MVSDTSIFESVRKNILFSDIENDDFILNVVEQLEIKQFKENNIIYKQGDRIDGLYLVVSGILVIYSERDNERYILSHAEANFLVGEFLLIGNSIRSTSAEVLKEATLLYLSVDRFKQLLVQFPEPGLLIASKIVNRMGWNQAILALRLSHLFVGLGENIVRCLMNEIEISCIPSNTLLFKQDEISDELCIIIDGRFQISRFIDNELKILGVVGRGETIGEIGVICQSLREANVLAIRDSTIANLSRSSYEKILLAFPLEINQTFVKSVINHLRKHEKHHVQQAETFVLAILSSNLSKQEIIIQLVDSLSKFGLTTSISSEFVDKAFSQKGAAQSIFEDEINQSLLQWLSEQEIAHQYIVFVIDDSMSQWTKRCIRQADHIVFFADAEKKPEIDDFESSILKEISNKSVKRTLVLNHTNSARVPADSSRWLAIRNLTMHHHVRQSNRSDIGRVARFLSGNAVGVVLGGGGAKGFAHIGVIRAFHELKIPIDLIGGNSMGALIAAQYAMQWSYKDMIDKTKHLCLQGDELTFPIMSIFSGKKMARGAFSMFGDICIEDLWLHYFSISCNISRATVMTHNSGSLFSAVLNSNTPPGLFPPQVVDGDLLVDGALLNNVPVDVMAKFNHGGTIIAVDVNAREDLLNNKANVGGISGWQLLINKINPFIETIKRPSMIEILSRASIIGGLAQRKKLMDGVADLYLQPPVNNFSLNAYKDAEKIERVGYEYARKVLQQWLDKKQRD